jgi:hypothetical protein
VNNARRVVEVLRETLKKEADEEKQSVQKQFDKEKQQMEEQVDTAKRRIQAQASRMKWMNEVHGTMQEWWRGLVANAEERACHAEQAMTKDHGARQQLEQEMAAASSLATVSAADQVPGLSEDLVCAEHTRRQQQMVARLQAEAQVAQVESRRERER